MAVVLDGLLTLFAVLALPVAFLAGAAVLATSSLRRANRVTPGRVAGSAPLIWLWSPSVAASLHRRLRSACELAATVAGPLKRGRRGRARSSARPEGIAELAREVVDEAVRLDRQLVTTSLAARGMARAHALAALDHDVRTVEEAARRVHRLAARRAGLVGAASQPALTLTDRIASMEDALGELQPGPPLI